MHAKRNYGQPLGNQPKRQLRLLLSLAFIGAFTIVFFLAKGDGAATAAELLRMSPPPSPIETPSPLPGPAPEIREVSPNQGVAGESVLMNVYGSHFAEAAKVFLVPAESALPHRGANKIPQQAIHLSTAWRSSHHLVAKIPGNIPPDLYGVGVVNPDGQADFKAKAYMAIRPDPTAGTDLSSISHALWTEPLFAGVPTKIGLRVRRLGGTGGTEPFFVDFYWNEINEEHKIGRGMVPSMAPDSTASSSAVEWTPDSHGDVTLIAVIDATGKVAETNEENNVVRRQVTVRFNQPSDVTPPVARRLNVETARSIVNSRNLKLSVEAFDPEPNPTGVNRSYYVEMQWFGGVNNGTGAWLPVQWSEWLSYESQPHDFELLPNSGIRYLLAWVADGAGNISAKPAVHRVNYIPATDSLEAGEVRVYRQPAVAGQCLRVRTVPDEPAMDPDIYVWGPSWTAGNLPTGYSIAAAGEPDEVIIQPTEAGVYQIEIAALTDASFSLDIQVTSSCARTRAAEARSASEKQPRTEPTIPVGDEPDGSETTPDGPSEYLLFMPPLFNSYLLDAQQSETIYLPLLQQ